MMTFITPTKVYVGEKLWLDEASMQICGEGSVEIIECSGEGQELNVVHVWNMRHVLGDVKYIKLKEDSRLPILIYERD